MISSHYFMGFLLWNWWGFSTAMGNYLFIIHREKLFSDTYTTGHGIGNCIDKIVIPDFLN